MIVYISDPKNSSRELIQLITPSVIWRDTRLPQQQTNKQITPVALLYTNEKWAERDIRETSTFTKATNNIKYLGVTLIKQVKDLYDKNVKSLKKEIKGELRRCGKIIHALG